MIIIIKDLEGNILFQGSAEYVEDFIPEIIGEPVMIETEED